MNRLIVKGVRKAREPGVPLRVLWLGTLCLRKGLPYAIEAAWNLMKEPVQFTFAGPSKIDLSQVKWPTNAEYVGQVPRSQVNELWRSHDLYVLPTLSDGFAITQIEAMAHGLPIIVTANCGDVVQHGESGLLVPARDGRSLADAVRKFLDKEISLEEASFAAEQRSGAFSPSSIWPSLRAIFITLE